MHGPPPSTTTPTCSSTSPEFDENVLRHIQQASEARAKEIAQRSKAQGAASHDHGHREADAGSEQGDIAAVVDPIHLPLDDLLPEELEVSDAELMQLQAFCLCGAGNSCTCTP